MRLSVLGKSRFGVEIVEQNRIERTGGIQF